MYTIYQKQLMLYFYFTLGELFHYGRAIRKVIEGVGIFKLCELFFVNISLA